MSRKARQQLVYAPWRDRSSRGLSREPTAMSDQLATGPLAAFHNGGGGRRPGITRRLDPITTYKDHRMNKYLLAAVIGSLSSSAFAACPYPLDATQAQYDGYQYLAGWMAATVPPQTLSYAVAPTTGLQKYAAFSSTGVTALTNANLTGVPGGDVALPASGVARVRMQIDSFPWHTLASPNGFVTVALGVITGNQANNVPLPKSSLNYTVMIGATGNGPVSLYVNGQSIEGYTIADVNQIDPVPLPFPADRIGLYFDMTTRTLGLSYRIMAGNWGPNVPPAGDYDIPLTDRQGNPATIPPGVSSVAIGLGGYQTNIVANDTAVTATLDTDICGSTTPSSTLPNGKPFKGNGHAYGIFGKP